MDIFNVACTISFYSLCKRILSIIIRKIINIKEKYPTVYSMQVIRKMYQNEEQHTYRSCFQNIKDKHMYGVIWVINNSQKHQNLLSYNTDLQFCKSVHVLVESKIWITATNNTRLKIYQHYCCLFYFCEEFHI